jgi:hypothetical protein
LTGGKIEHIGDLGDPHISLIEDLDSISIIASCIISLSKPILAYMLFEENVNRRKAAIAVAIDKKRVLGAISSLRVT